MSEKLELARQYEAEHVLKRRTNARPAYHLTGNTGWINDPNGFSVYKGEVHLFFQANQYEKKAGSIHWAHVKTDDFIHWERLPMALAPDMPYDKDGCFSGGALETGDGKHLIMYTGYVECSERPGDVLQTQCMAIGDGTDYEKYEGNPVLTGKDLPEGGSAADFRDPKIWKDEDRFLAAVVNRDREARAAVLVFESTDGLSWKYKGTAAVSTKPHGRMWECPDIFTLDGKDVLLFSIQGQDEAEQPEDRAYETKIRTGIFDKESCLFREDAEYLVDYGDDFYAPQTVLLPDGRRIMTAWMQCWRTSMDVPDDLDFRGQMICPRELYLKNGVLFQRPVRELDQMRGRYSVIKKHEGSGCFTHENMHGRCCDLEITLRKKASGKRQGKFRIHVAEDHSHRTVIEADLDEGTITVDLTASGNAESMSGKKSFLAGPADDKMTIRILLDRYSLELFVNDGVRAAAFALFAPQEADRISFEAEDGIIADIEHYELEI